MRKMKINQKKIVAGVLALSFVLSLIGPVYQTNGDYSVAVVEAAKKDKKKPKITLIGKKKLTTEVGKNVTIPKTTYSDNVTKKKKLKVGVTVIKGKKDYKDIAKKIKKATLSGKTVKVKFSEEGTYKIAYTVTDEAKNKATATRTVNVKANKEQIVTTETPTENIVTEQPTSVAEIPTNQIIPTEEVTEIPNNVVDLPVEVPTEPIDEEPTTEEDIKNEITDFEIKNVEVDGKNYKVIDDIDFGNTLTDTSTEPGVLDIIVENDYDYLRFNINTDLLINNNYLKYLGNISAVDSEGNDISDNIIIYSPNLKPNTNKKIYCTNIYVNDDKGNSLIIPVYLYVENFDNYINDYIFESTMDSQDYFKINENPLIYAHSRKKQEKN